MNFVEECVKCKNDIVYFIEKYVKILHYKRGLIPFELFDYQKRLLKTYEEDRFVILKKFRQGGFTTLTGMYGLWRCLFFNDQRFLILHKTDKEAMYHAKMIQRAIDYLPDQFQVLLTHSNGHEKRFDCTGSSMLFLRVESAKGKSMTHLIFDEAAFITKMEDHWQAMWPTIPPHGKVFVLSTTNGIGNWFYDTYERAASKKSDFKVFENSYLEHPEYNNAAWVAQTKKNLGPKLFAQEVEAHWVSKYDDEVKPEDILRYEVRDIVTDHSITGQDMVNRISDHIKSYKANRFSCQILEEFEKDSN